MAHPVQSLAAPSTQILLMRHGEAALGYADAERPLTERGRQAVFEVAEDLAGLSIQAPGILSSPLLRARESAGLVAERLQLPLLPVSHALIPQADAAALVKQLFSVKKSVFWVFHQPVLAEVVFILTGSRVYPETAGVYALKGSWDEAWDGAKQMNFEVEWKL